jgi:hypothetical protein
MTVDVPQRAGIGGPIMVPATSAELQPALYLTRGDGSGAGGINDAHVYIYSRAAFDGDDPDAEFLCTWDFTGVGGMVKAFQARALPDGRVLVGGWTAANLGVLIEVPANAPMEDGTPPCRVVYAPVASGAIIGIAQSVYGEILLGMTPVGPNQVHKLAGNLVGTANAIAANTVVYDDAGTASEPLGASDMCADAFSPGFVWTVRYSAGGSAALWDMNGPAGTLVPSVLFTGSNWNGNTGVAVSDSNELVTANYDDNQVGVFTSPYASGNPAPNRTLVNSNPADQRPSAVLFDARNGNLVVVYYDSGTVAIFSQAQFLAGGTQTPIRRFNTGLPTMQHGELASGIGVRR